MSDHLVFDSRVRGMVAYSQAADQVMDRRDMMGRMDTVDGVNMLFIMFTVSITPATDFDAMIL